MIWSTTPERVTQNIKALENRGMLRRTDILDASLNTGSVPVRYFEVPPQAHRVGKLVLPYLCLNSRGRLDPDSPRVYGVTRRPDGESFSKKGAVITRLQEAHVLADDRAFQNGIFSATGRTEVELEVAAHIPDVYRDGFVTDRLAHLAAQHEEINLSNDLSTRMASLARVSIEQASETLQNTYLVD